MGRLVHRLSRSRRSWLKNLLIRGFIRLYRIDISEADPSVAEAYPSLNAFFTRSLRAGARPLDPAPHSVLSPADGTLEQLGRIDGSQPVTAKGFRFSSAALLAVEEAEAARYAGGEIATIYLAPHNYHRFHMPVDARIRRVSCIPGQRFAVNRRTARSVEGLFAANERVVCHCETASGGALAIVLVGAMNVASISLAFHGELMPRPGRTIDHLDFAATDPRVQLARGELLGQFNLGSTVILLAAPGVLCWDATLGLGQALRMGQRLGRLVSATPHE